MITSFPFWSVQSGNWSLEQAICYLAFGKADIPLVPERSPEITLGDWLNIRSDRTSLAKDSVGHLVDALNKREIQALGCELPVGFWSTPRIQATGLSPEDSASIERTVRAKGKGSRFRLSIDLTACYSDGGIALALKNDAAGLLDIVKLYVMVELEAAKVRQLKRRLEFERTQKAEGPERKRRPGRPGIPGRIMEIHLERENAGQALPKAIQEAQICCEVYRKEGNVEEVQPDTVARKIGELRRKKTADPRTQSTG
jgi:hypothetical protein